MSPTINSRLRAAIGVVLCVFVVVEVNYPHLTPQSQLSLFTLLGLLLVYLKFPVYPGWRDRLVSKLVDGFLALACLFCFGYVFVQSEPMFQNLWIGGQPLGNRAGNETPMDYAIGLLGLFLVLEGARRAVGWTLPLLSLAFMAYAAFGPSLPDWLFPHRGYPWQRIVAQSFLHSQGVFGIALNVMFTYVFLFILFGAFLEKTGATGFIIAFARRLLGRSAGGPAKVAVLSSGMMGSLSGSAVANTATTGTFTIPMMRSAGFKPTVAAAVEAAASSGGALVPPVMGAGAYMMLEIVEPQVTYLEIIKAAAIPAIFYYLALLLIVHFYAKKKGTDDVEMEPEKLEPMQGLVFFGSFAALILFLLMGFTPFRAVSFTLLVILGLGVWHPKTRMGLRAVITACVRAAESGTALIAAASCVGAVLGIVTLTGIGAKLPGVLMPLAENNLLLALFLLMVSTIILGMGLPSAVCYLLMATLIGPVLGDLGVVPLAAHLFIFYFGMMSMVTPPVALAAYTAASIADTDIMKTGFAAFRFSLIGFALPFAFVIHPELLLLAPVGGQFEWLRFSVTIAATLVGIFSLAAGISGYLLQPLPLWARIFLTLASFLFLLVPNHGIGLAVQGVAVIAILGIAMGNRKKTG